MPALANPLESRLYREILAGIRRAADVVIDDTRVALALGDVAACGPDIAVYEKGSERLIAIDVGYPIGGLPPAAFISAEEGPKKAFMAVCYTRACLERLVAILARAGVDASWILGDDP